MSQFILFFNFVPFGSKMQYTFLKKLFTLTYDRKIATQMCNEMSNLRASTSVLGFLLDLRTSRSPYGTCGLLDVFFLSFERLILGWGQEEK